MLWKGHTSDYDVADIKRERSTSDYAVSEIRREMSFLGGLSLHLNHLIASHTANYDWPFGTLPFGFFGSNLDTRDLETSPRTYSGDF